MCKRILSGSDGAPMFTTARLPSLAVSPFERPVEADAAGGRESLRLSNVMPVRV
jgi:hypothetical protein